MEPARIPWGMFEEGSECSDATSKGEPAGNSGNSSDHSKTNYTRSRRSSQRKVSIAMPSKRHLDSNETSQPSKRRRELAPESSSSRITTPTSAKNVEARPPASEAAAVHSPTVRRRQSSTRKTSRSSHPDTEQNLFGNPSLLVGETLLKIAETNTNQQISDKITAAAIGNSRGLSSSGVGSRIGAALRSRAKEQAIDISEVKAAYAATRKSNRLQLCTTRATDTKSKSKSALASKNPDQAHVQTFLQ